MAGGNPLRQAMINMMYLVLLALMAMNVSAEVLKAFETVHSGILESNRSLTDKNQSTMERFSELLENDRERTLPHYNKAQKANEISDSLFNYIQDIKDQIIQESGGYLKDSTLAGAKNLDIGTRILVRKDKGDTLQNKINNTREELIGILESYNEDTSLAKISEATIAKVKRQIPLKAEDPPKGPDNKNSWAAANFDMVPITASATILSKIQSDVKNAKSEILNTLIDQVGKSGITFDVFTPIVKAKKGAVAVNEEFEAEIMLGAYSSTQNPDITVDGKEVPVEDGKGKFTTTPSSSGEKSLPGTIKVKDPSTGEIKDYDFNVKFNAFDAPAIVSLDAMNVLYTGLENPVSVSVPGYKPEQVSASISNGRLIKQEPGKYVAKVSDGRETFISVSVQLEEGNVKNVGKKRYRIRPVPKPTPEIMGKTSGNMSRAEAQNAQAIIASLGESFVFEGVEYRVTKYRFTYVPRRGNMKEDDGNGPRLSGKMKSWLSNVSKGDRIIIDQIYARGPDGEKRLPNGITLTIQ